MTIRTACISAGAAALALPAFAGDLKPLTPQFEGPGRYVQPDRAASVALVNGKIVLTSDWIELGATTRNPPDTYAWDSFESDAAGFPTDDAGAGCTTDPTLPIPVGSRIYFGATYNNPFVSNDMTTDAAGAGVACEGVNIAWYWNIDDVGGAPYDDSDGNGEVDQTCVIAVFTSETFSTPTDATVCDNDGTTSVIPGVAYTFNGASGLGLDDAFPGAGPSQGYYFSNIDLTGSGLSHVMPSTGVGGNLVVIGSAIDGAGVITITGGAGDIYSQCMLWGTGEDEPGPSVRLGTQDAIQFDDDVVPSDGVHTLACFPAGEGYSYSYGICPEPLGACLGFLYKGGVVPCPCAGDLNGDGIVDISDLALFLAQFGSADGGCDDINADGVTDISDLALFLAAFGSTCP
jgi:hypothetical protein